ncbi:MAG: DUF4398 domain-containing protein [Chitinivibrionales bacterium]|nr:DUF4398 domain-containing protein [Chitinivibrionales bacterium]
MHKVIGLMSVAVVCMTGIFTGCAQAPEEELASAKAAFQAAEEAEAEKYLPNNYQNVQKALQAVETEISLQKKKFFLARSFARADAMLENVSVLAEDLKNEAPKAKVELKAQVEAGLTSAEGMIKDTRAAVKRAPRSLGRKAVVQMAADVDTAESAITVGMASLNGGDILGARENLAKAQSLLKNVFGQLKPDDE